MLINNTILDHLNDTYKIEKSFEITSNFLELILYFITRE